MTVEEIKQLIELLNKFETLPCDMECKDEYEECPLFMGGKCEVLYVVSKFIKGKVTLEDTIDRINADFKNTKGFTEI